MKLFLDANVLFTAAYSANGISRNLFLVADAGHCSLVTSTYAADEARRNLLVKAPAAVAVFDALLRKASLVKEPAFATVQRMMKLPLADKDAPIMAAAVEAKVDVLVTGDRNDFGHLFGTTVEGVVVLLPVESLKRVIR